MMFDEFEAGRILDEAWICIDKWAHKMGIVGQETYYARGLMFLHPLATSLLHENQELKQRVEELELALAEEVGDVVFEASQWDGPA